MTLERRLQAALLWGALLIAVPRNTVAQGTLEDYKRAAGLNQKYQGLVVNVPEAPHWIGESHRFWYRRSVAGGADFVLVNATTREKAAAFDHDRLAAALSTATDSSYTALRLPFTTFTFTTDEQGIEFIALEARWRCGVREYTCTRLGPAPGGAGGRGGGQGGRGGGPAQATGERPETERRSPDGKWEAGVQNFNVAVRPVGTREWTLLSHDGSEGDAYSFASIAWSPDSRKIAAYRVKPGYRRVVHYVESSPTDQLQPKHSERVYTKPGDVLDVQQPVLFDVGTKEQVTVDGSLFPNPYGMSRFEWRKDSRAVTFEYNQRGHQVFRVIEVDATTGTPRVVISEEPKTFFSYRPANGSQRDSGKKFRYDVADGREVIWMSERDGWNHLYMMDGATGRAKHQITKGEWVVRNVEWVDEPNRQIWFRASGMNPDQDPYFVHSYRINFDGTGLVAFTEANGEHNVSFSRDREYYVDSWSRVDLPPIAQLRRTSDRSMVMELERADASALLATGWKPPEVFDAKGRDGQTDIWGVIVRPTNFDPTKTYPVIENIYAGPQGSFVPKSFSTQAGMQSLAELGFIVVQMDGMGTSNRSKAFHDVAWKNLGDAGFPDRILWHKAVAARYQYYDLSRVGIYGTSAGGQNAMGGLLFHPDFYHVGVSAAGCHDNRMDKIWWNEHWMSWPLGPHYERSSNMVNADKLQGKLLLVVGEMDTNVDPSSTLQVVNALIKADKTFDMLFLPGAGHTNGGEYGGRARNDFFVRHLLGVSPPDWNAGVTLRADSSEQRDAEFPPSDDGSPSFFDYSEDFRWWARS